MTFQREKADFVFSGSGTLLDALAGAGERLCSRYDPVRLAGTSGGAFVACGRAHGMPWANMKEIGAEVLGGGLLDFSSRPWERWGLIKGDHLHAIIRANFPGRMGDAPLPWCCYATDLWAKETVRFSSWETPDIRTADAVRASIAIPAFFKGMYITLPRETRPRFLVDGGLAANFAMDAFDDEPDRPTIGIRFTPGAAPVTQNIKLTGYDFFSPQRVAKKTARYVSAILDILLESGAKAHMSDKNKAREVLIDAGRESGLDFWLDGADIDKRWGMGAKAAALFLEKNHHG